MNLKRAMARLVAGLMAACMLILSGSGFATNVNAQFFSVPTAIQSRFNWCWVACAEMVGRFYRPSTTRRQEDAYRHIRGGLGNTTGTSAETRIAARWIAHNQPTIGVSQNSLSFNSVRAMVNGRIPIIAGRGALSGGTTGHMYVIHGYNNTVSPRVWFTDPVNGVTTNVLYDFFLRGFNNRFWRSSVF